MPPVNDNFAAATAIGGQTGSIGSQSQPATNIGATAQAGEPANNGSTVWYRWTCPNEPDAPASVQFSTRYAGINPGIPQPFRSILQIFGGTSLANLAEMTYLPMGNFNAGYGSDFGSLVAFTPIQGNSYYIRVDGVAGAQGNFILEWSNFYVPILDIGGPGCGGCWPQFDANLKCSQTASLAIDSFMPAPSPRGSPPIEFPFNVTLAAFHAVPKGQYLIIYCGGAWCNFGGSSADPGTWGIQDSGEGAGSIALSFSGVGAFPAGTPNYQYLNPVFEANPPEPFFTDPNAYQSQAETESHFACGSLGPFNWNGGLINAVISGEGGAVNKIVSSGGTVTAEDYTVFPFDGNPPPTFTLAQCIENISLDPSAQSLTAGWTTPGSLSAAFLTFNLDSNNGFSWIDCTVSVALSGTGAHITQPAPQTGITLAPGANSFEFNFSSNTPNLTAVITVQCPYFANGTKTFEVFIGPIIKLTSHNEFRGTTSCVPQTFGCHANLQNIGYWDESGANFAFTINTFPRTSFYTVGSGCATADTNGTINQNSGFGNGYASSGALAPGSAMTLLFDLKPTGAIQVTNINVIVQDFATGIQLLNTSYAINLPAS